MVLLSACVTAERDDHPDGEGGAPAQDPRVAAAVAGDRQAAASLLRDLVPRVRNLCRYLVRGDSDVDDLAQEGLIAVMRGLPTFRGESRLESWVDRVVARQALAGARRRRLVFAREASHAVDLQLVGATASPGAEQYVARRELARRLDDLPAAQREALVLHHVVGLSVPEVAAEIGAPLETVRSRLRLGKARLGESYKEGSHAD